MLRLKGFRYPREIIAYAVRAYHRFALSTADVEDLLADKAFDANWLLQELDARGATAVISPKANRKIQRSYDTEVYKWRHLGENDFGQTV